MNEFYESVGKNKLRFEYVGNTKDVSFYEYMDSKELFDKIKSKFDDALKKQEESLNKINDVKIGRKNHEQEEVIANLETFYHSREEVFSFFRDYSKMMLDSSYKPQQNETKGTGLKILTPQQMLQRLPISLAQKNTGNNSEILLNEMRHIVYSLYQSKETTKKVYNNMIKSIQ